jgi:hypothetical protein
MLLNYVVVDDVLNEDSVVNVYVVDDVVVVIVVYYHLYLL